MTTNAVYDGLKTAVETDNALAGLLKVMDALMEENNVLKTRLKRRAEQPLRKQIEGHQKQMENMEEQFKFQLTSLNEKHISMVSSYAGVVKEQQEKITELEEKLRGLTDAMIETKFQLKNATSKGNPASNAKVILKRVAPSSPKQSGYGNLHQVWSAGDDCELTEE
jgi:uncharacterized membrane protein YheB (UPF0754 family)